FVAYFPQLVAGPIERARQLMPQLSPERRYPDTGRVYSAVALIIVGLFKKVALADQLAPIVARTFSGASDLGSLDLIAGMVAFGIEIYTDFSAYTDIARGSSRLLGIDLIENFRQPYFSRSVTEFWRRWHMSLSSWLRDYLYIPLGGNRKGTRRTALNILVTMLLGGLWHGASWTFVAWGGLHASFLIVERFSRSRGAASANPARDFVKILRTFALVTVAWVFFRAASFDQAFDYLRGVFSLRGLDHLPAQWYNLAGIAMATFALDLIRSARGAAILFRHPVLAGAALGLMTVGLITESAGSFAPFIYLRF
ncbi:MAG: MBOAT family O-acyltransferase, partial [Actinomycetota bacterium]